MYRLRGSWVRPCTPVGLGIRGRRTFFSEPFAATEPFLSRIGRRMNKASQQKVVQYLHEARASEDALVRVLQSQIAMTPSVRQPDDLSQCAQAAETVRPMV